MTSFPTGAPPSIINAATTALNNASHDHDQHHLDIDERLGQLEPSTASRLQARASAEHGIVSGGTSLPHWATIVEQVGTDITVDGGDDTLIDINTDGLYFVEFEADLTPDVGGEKIQIVSANPSGSFSFPVGAPYLDGLALNEFIVDTFFPLVFIPAGSTFRVGWQINTSGGGAWSNNGPRVVVQRLL